MKKISYLLVIVGIIAASILAIPTLATDNYVITTPSGISITGTSYLRTTMVNQDPISAEPGGYVDVLFKIENHGTEPAEKVRVELLPAYPFSLEPGVNATQELGTIKGSQTGDDAFLVRYKLKVDKDAVDGVNEINLKTSGSDASGGSSQFSSIQTFNVTVLNPRTDFDVVLQSSTTTTSSVSDTGTTSTGGTAASTMLAVANTGANPASAVIVRIPTQDNFRTTGTNGNIIGNLNAGDYTIVTFQVVPNGAENARNSTFSSNSTPYGEKNLTVEISYTDTLGIRRTVQKYVPIGSLTRGSGYLTTRATQSTQLPISNSLLYIGIGAVGIVAIVALLKFRTRKKK